MKKFLQFSVGVFLILAGISLVIASVQPAYGERERLSHAAPETQPLNVLYVNIDTINNTYKAYTELADSANNRLQTALTAYNQMAEELQKRYAVLQERVNMGTISTDAAQKEETAINMGLDLLHQQEAQLAFLEGEAMAKNDSISVVVAVFFEEYAKTHNVDYVLMYGTGMPIIYANPALDVTTEAVTQLNADYDRAHPPVKKTDRFGKEK